MGSTVYLSSTQSLQGAHAEWICLLGTPGKFSLHVIRPTIFTSHNQCKYVINEQISDIDIALQLQMIPPIHHLTPQLVCRKWIWGYFQWLLKCTIEHTQFRIILLYHQTLAFSELKILLTTEFPYMKKIYSKSLQYHTLNSEQEFHSIFLFYIPGICVNYEFCTIWKKEIHGSPFKFFLYNWLN